VAFTERKQGLHDMIAGTLVVKRSSVPAEPASQTMSGAAPDRPTPR